MQDHYWVVEYLTNEGYYTCWSIHPTRSEARENQKRLTSPSRIRKYIPA